MESKLSKNRLQAVTKVVHCDQLSYYIVENKLWKHIYVLDRNIRDDFEIDNGSFTPLAYFVCYGNKTIFHRM